MRERGATERFDLEELGTQGFMVSGVVLAATALVILIGASVSDPGVIASDIPPEIAEATFRYQFAHNASAQRARAQVYCIGLGTTTPGLTTPDDPPPAFVSRFGNVSPAVKAYSECSVSATDGVRDRTTGGRGLVFTLTSMRCANGTTCTVEGGYYEAGLSASGNTYFLERRDGGWIVVRDVMHWIS
jgi:hypothetical protein